MSNLNRRNAAVACFFSLAFIGCLRAPFHRGTIASTASEEGAAFQTGQVSVPGRAFADVYYAAPFAGNPRLDLSDRWSQCVVVQESASHFRVLNKSDSLVKATWTARGPKVSPASAVGQPARMPPAPPPRAMPPVAPSNSLPAEPEPIAGPGGINPPASTLYTPAG